MPSVVRRARPEDAQAIRDLIAARPLEAGGAAHDGGVLVIPSLERLEKAIETDIVAVAVRKRDGLLLAAAMMMTAETFRESEWWDLRMGLEHPGFDQSAAEDISVAYFEILIASEECTDRRPLIRVAYEAIWAAAATHEALAAATVEEPVTNKAAQRLLAAGGFLDVGLIQHRLHGFAVTARIHLADAKDARDVVDNPDEGTFVASVLGMRATLPPMQFGPAAWQGRYLKDRPEEWTWRLEDGQITELVSAVNESVRSEADLLSLTADEVPLPSLGPELANARTDLLDGRGFLLVKGLPVTDMSPLERAGCFMALGLHLGSPRPQNAAGDLLGHIRDIGLSTEDPDVRIYQTNERQTFHTDSADVVGLCCIRPAKSGGQSLLVSAMTLYNELISEDPELVAHLMSPVATDRRGEIPNGAKPFFEIPPFVWFADQLSMLYQRQYVDSAQRFDDAPRLSPEVVAAMDRLDQLTNDPQLQLAMDLEPGDIQFVNNHVLLHDRTSFVDHDQPDNKRHLLRLWLSMPGDRPLPDVYAQRFGSIKIGDRGGIYLPGSTPSILVD